MAFTSDPDSCGDFVIIHHMLVKMDMHRNTFITYQNKSHLCLVSVEQMCEAKGNYTSDISNTVLTYLSLLFLMNFVLMLK